jgi:hypothetical protein
LFGQATHSIRYWGARLKRRGIYNNDDPVVDYYILKYNVDKARFDTKMTVSTCIRQLKNTRGQLKDVLKDAKRNGSFYEV